MENNEPFVPPEAGPELFRKIRETIDKGNTSEEPPAVEKPPQPTDPKTKKLEGGSGN